MTTNLTLLEKEQAERRGNKTQGWLQSDKDAHKQMWQLGLKHPTALLVLHFMVSKMSRGANGIIISAPALARQVGLSERAIKAAIAVLRDSRFVQVLKSGNTNAYIVNSKVAWQGPRGARHASFNAQIVVDELEQSKTLEELEAESEQMIEVPVMHMFDTGDDEGEMLDIESTPTPAKTKKSTKQDVKQPDLLDE